MVEVEQNTDNTGTFTDPRDGQTYKTVKIGSRIWMAENLSYEFADSYCVDGDRENEKKYGRLYTWKAAKVARPDGWHIPSKEEWDALEKFVADTLFRGDKDYVGYALKAKKGWDDDCYDDGNGSDAFGFGALPAGFCSKGGALQRFGNAAYFWLGSSDSYRSLFNNCMNLGFNYFDSASYMASVRCVKDS